MCKTSNLHNSFFTVNFQNLTTASCAISESDVHDFLVLWALKMDMQANKLSIRGQQTELLKNCRLISSIFKKTIHTFTLSNITRGPATPETVLYSAHIEQITNQYTSSLLGSLKRVQHRMTTQQTALVLMRQKKKFDLMTSCIIETSLY